MEHDHPVEIGIVLRDKAMLGIIHGLTDLFRIADDLNRERQGCDAAAIRVCHYANTGAGGIVRTFDSLPEAIALNELQSPSFVIIPPCQTAAQGSLTDPTWSNWLTARHAEGAVLGSICGGTFLLAQTGLLDGRRATTHLLCAPDLATMYPAVDVDVDALMIDDDDMITVGGVMAWTDLGLVIVERLLGADAMRDTARFMMIDPPNRQQRFYRVFSPDMEHGDIAISKAQHQVHLRANGRYKVSDMAAWSGLEIRTFIRRFHAATGLRPNEYHQQMRIENARKLLETTTEPIAKVGWDVGYDDVASFRMLFARLTGLTPSDYRKRFGYGASPAPQAIF